MKKNLHFLLLAAGMMGLGASSFGQDKQEKSKSALGEYDQIIIKRKGEKDAKVTIEIKDDKVTINGKPLAEFDDENVIIFKRDIDVMDGNSFSFKMPSAPKSPGSPFREGQSWNWNEDRMIELSSMGAFLGVGTEKTDKGLVIKEITKESAAEKAGLKAGDIITKVDELTVSTPNELSTAIRKYKPEEKVTITYKREGKEKKVTATLGKRENMIVTSPNMNFDFRMPEQDFDLRMMPEEGMRMFRYYDRGMKIGIKAQDTEDGKGVKVLEIDEESSAEKAGLKANDVITNLDGKAVNSVNELMEIVNKARADKKVSMPVKFTREGKELSADLKLPRKLKTAEL